MEDLKIGDVVFYSGNFKFKITKIIKKIESEMYVQCNPLNLNYIKKYGDHPIFFNTNSSKKAY